LALKQRDVRKQKESRDEMMRRTARYSLLDCKNEKIF